MTTLLIDGDILVVSTCAAAQEETHMGDDEWALTTDVASVKRSIERAIEGLKHDLEADDAVVTLSKGTTFRHRIYEPYKAGRGRKPVGVAETKRWLIEECNAKLIPDIEADDVMGILSTNPRIIKGEKIIVSADKDMMTIPGAKVYREGEVIEISPELAEYNWLTQTLTGDTTDGYPGCPGIGPKKAEIILKKECSWENVLATFEKAGLTEEEALTQARLARILRTEDYDFKKKEVILWQA